MKQYQLILKVQTNDELPEDLVKTIAMVSEVAVFEYEMLQHRDIDNVQVTAEVIK